MPINKEKLELREKVASSRPEFIRPESWRYKRLQTTWRKPKGVDNHQRKQKSRGRPGIVKIGYGGPKIAKGLHPSGFTDNLVFNVGDLEKLNPKNRWRKNWSCCWNKETKRDNDKSIRKKIQSF